MKSPGTNLRVNPEYCYQHIDSPGINPTSCGCRPHLGLPDLLEEYQLHLLIAKLYLQSVNQLHLLGQLLGAQLLDGRYGRHGFHLIILGAPIAVALVAIADAVHLGSLISRLSSAYHLMILIHMVDGSHRLRGCGRIRRA